MNNVLKALGQEISAETLRDTLASRFPSNDMRMMGKRSLNDEILLTNAMIRRISKKEREPAKRQTQEEKDRIKWLYFDMFN